MPKASPYPNHPIRVLRNLLGFTSAESFAKFVGIPAETIRNFEQGRRAVTERAATQIGISTGVYPEWLQTGKEAKGQPKGFFGKLTKEKHDEYCGLRARLSAEPNLEPVVIGHVEMQVARVLRAALRKGKLGQCRYGIELALREVARDLDIEGAVRKETTPEIDGRFDTLSGKLPAFGENGELGEWDFFKACELLSSTGLFRWEEELADPSLPRMLLNDIDTLREVVEASFDLPRRDLRKR